MSAVSPKRSPVGSRAGARTVGSGGCSTAFAVGLSPAPLATSPAPATSNGAGGFPALRSPARFTPRLMRPAVAAALSALAHGHRLLHLARPAQPSSWRISSVSGLADQRVLLSRHPCLPCCRRSREQQGPFAPRALPRFVATADPSATLSSSADFPVLPVIRPTQLPRISPRDEEGFSSCSLCPCRRAVANHPAGVTRRIDRSATCHAAFAFSVAGSASGTSTFRGDHAFTAVTARRLAPIPRMGLSMGFRSFGFPPACHPATGLPIVTPTGLTPAGHSSLFWTHNRPTRFSGPTGSDTDFSGPVTAAAGRGTRTEVPCAPGDSGRR